MGMTFIYFFSALLVLGQCEHSAKDKRDVLDQIEVVLTKYPDSDEFIARAYFALENEEKHFEYLPRLMKTPRQFERYVLKMVGKKLTLGSESMDDRMNRTKYDWFQELTRRFGRLFQRSTFASFLPSAAVAAGATTNIWSLTEKFTETLKSLQRAKQLKIAGTILTVSYLGYDIFINVREWYNNRIDGLIAIRNIASTFATSIAGILIGGSCGAFAGPGAAIVCGSVGGSIASEFLHTVFDSFFGASVERVLAKSYEMLGLSKEATQHQIRAAYLRLAKKHHPDHNPSDAEKASKKFIDINLAYEMIRAERFSIKSSSSRTEL